MVILRTKKLNCRDANCVKVLSQVKLASVSSLETLPYWYVLASLYIGIY